MGRFGVRRYLLAGCLILLPIWLTVLAARWTFGLLADVSEPAVRPALNRVSDATGTDLDWLLVLVGALLTLLVIYLVGWVGSRAVGARLHRGFDRLLTRVPLVKVIYGSAKRMLSVLEVAPEKAERVVLIESPRSGSTSVGFVTQVLTDTTNGKEYAAVFVPTTPNPTSGALELIPVEDLRRSGITVDEAMSFVLSGGAVAPSRFTEATAADVDDRDGR